MSGTTDLEALLAEMAPALAPGIFVFVTLKSQPVPAGLTAQMLFEEREGTTLIVSAEAAREYALEPTFRCRMITLKVHSSLEAVGFLARITTALADAGIGVNPVSGYFHDHLFVPEDRADDAMAILSTLSAAARRP